MAWYGNPYANAKLAAIYMVSNAKRSHRNDTDIYRFDELCHDLCGFVSISTEL